MTTPSVNPSLPANYDSVDLWIHPSGLQWTVNLLIATVNDLTSEIGDVMTTLNGLQLGWAGTSASEAQSFFTEWSNVMTDMFGSQQDPGSGVLNTLIKALGNAAQNFDAQEAYITSIFHAIEAACSAPSSHSSTPQLPSVAAINDPTQTAVAESYD